MIIKVTNKIFSSTKLGRGIMESSIHFETNNVLPLMNVNKAMYGHPRDNSKVSNLIFFLFTSNSALM